ncbi:MAG TPA: hypothetical protein VFV87_04915 [Pirellulaceae bacterium]|nr:hypothetical protein [Pirellulaceae bacterium]
MLAQIIRNDEELSVGTGGPEIVQQSKRTVYEGSAESVEYTVTTRLAGGRKVTTILRVDPQTHLPQSATIRQSEGSELLCRFDYPEFGPEDVYALGVAKNAIVVDRVPSADLQRVATGVLNGRRQFDDYYCLLVHSSANQHWSQASRMYRTWRKGDCWRIEQSFTDPEDDEALARQPLPPDDVDRKAYWFQRAKETRFYPVLVCDGQHIWRFKQEFDQPTEKRFTFKTTGAERDPVDFDQSFVMLPLFTPAPELEGHSAPLGGTSAKVVERLNPHPDQGPAGTVLVEREYIGRRGQPQKQDLDRYWVDPVNGYLVMRHEMVDLDHDPPQIIQSREIADWKRSPRGFFYPVELKWDESGIAHYYLDFVTPDAAMFSPKATESIKQRVATR